MEINYSIIIPHHNSPHLLDRCLASIPQREDLEIIVVDDNSVENKRPNTTRSDVRIITIDASQTKGAGRARNYGMAEAKGKWLLFADCDDFYAKGFLEVLDNYKESNYDIIFYDAYFRYEPDTGKYSRNKFTSHIKLFLSNPDNEQLKKELKHCSNTPWLRMIRKVFVEKIGAKFSEVPVCNDGYFAHFTSYMTDNIFAIDQKLYYWCKTAESLSTRKKSYEIEKGRIREGKRIHKILKKDNVSEMRMPFWRNFIITRKQLGLWVAIKLAFYKLINGYSII